MTVGPGDTAAAVVDHPSGFLALSPRCRRFTRAGLRGFIAYRLCGRHRIGLGGVHAPPEERAALLDAFLAETRAARQRALAVQVREDQVELFRRRGFAVNQFGSSFGLDLSAFTLGGARRLKLRNRIQRARQAGVRVVELGRDLPSTPEAWQLLLHVSRTWLAGKRAPELEFLIGELGQPGDPLRRVFAAVEPSGRLPGFITYVPAWGARPGYLHDLTRRLPAAPPGTMELVNAAAIERFTAEGAAFLHFGFTPFVVDAAEPPGGHAVLAWLLRLIARRGAFLYPARTQRDYKMKWGPDLIEREYLALDRVTPGAIWALLVVTRSVPWPPRRRAQAPAPALVSRQEVFP